MKKIFSFIGVLALNLVVAIEVRAQGFLNGNDNPAPGIFVGPGRFGGETPQDILLTIMRLMLELSGMVATVFLILGSYYYMTSNGNEDQAEKGKKIIFNSVIGFAVVILSYVILIVVENAIQGRINN
jgi:hypothetical protein